MNFSNLLTRALIGAFVLMTGSQAFAARTTTFFHGDGLGSVVAATNEAGAVLWRKDYAPFGEQIDTTPDNERISYTGKQHDDVTGLTHFGARSYDPELARFMGADPIASSAGNGAFFNRYWYANSNPYRYIDLFGAEPIDVNAGLTWWDRLNPFRLIPWERGVPSTASFMTGVNQIHGGPSDDPVVQLLRKREADMWEASAYAVAEVAKEYPRLIAINAVGEIPGVGPTAAAFAREAGILRAAARGKGNFGLGSGSRAEADRLGQAWVGNGARTASDGKTMVSADKMRQYRPPSYKPRLGRSQANFEQRTEQGGSWISNGHLDVTQ